MFSQGAIEALGVYVYRLDDPRDGRPFYVGKGVGNRAYAHIEEARAGFAGAKCDIIREILTCGLMPTLIVHRHRLDDATAKHVEAALIDAYGLNELTNLVHGQGTDLGAVTAEEFKERFEAPPANLTMPCILLKIGPTWERGLTAAQLYARTRMYWRANPERRQTPPTHAISVAGGLIREVYRIDGWTYEPEITPDPDRLPGWDEGEVAHGRVAFTGNVDPTYAHLIGTSVHGRFRSQNPVAYANCG